MNRPLTAEYIVELFEGVKDCQSKTDWEHNKKRFIELIKEYGTEQCNLLNVMPSISPEECDCIDLVHKIDRDQFPYGDDLEYDECPKCKARYHLKVV